jgi:uncharacterized protein (DUF433 family)/transposase-like protein
MATGVDLSLYGGKDPRDHPRYTYREVARAVDIPPSTVAAWARGYAYGTTRGGGSFKPVIRLPKAFDSRLSFNNLIEVSVLRALRKVHEVQLGSIREALKIAEREHGVERLLISPELRTAAGQLFLVRYGALLELSPARQLALEGILEQFLERVNFEQAHFFPIERVSKNAGTKLILVSPFVSFGQPILKRVGVSTHVIAERLNANEDRKAILEDYSLQEDEFEEAIFYESAA